MDNAVRSGRSSLSTAPPDPSRSGTALCGPAYACRRTRHRRRSSASSGVSAVEIRHSAKYGSPLQSFPNPIRFPGQYQDNETGLHYNRHRYYEPRQGRFISKDPISYRGGLNLYAYTPNPVGWTDASGLCSTRLDRNLGGVKYDNHQAHHIIPEEVWKNNINFLTDIGIGADMDNKENGFLMPHSAAKATQMKRKFYHCGSHDIYSRGVQKEIDKIHSAFYSERISKDEARQRISAIQTRNRALLKTPSIPGTSPIRLS
ncbi:AHH domain-containing protein [Pseudomonas taiwanensis]|uniref:AHH domain-containing protein n=1 Tax=Pseudomonas taiwanensis TaxID=470150 RepID=A0ABR6V681_9PSED|nr:AHH domain-containing protein [Pseudomonas taiwanensis]